VSVGVSVCVSVGVCMCVCVRTCTTFEKGRPSDSP
jgi:hypothetical protein